MIILFAWLNLVTEIGHFHSPGELNNSMPRVAAGDKVTVHTLRGLSPLPPSPSPIPDSFEQMKVFRIVSLFVKKNKNQKNYKIDHYLMLSNLTPKQSFARLSVAYFASIDKL